MDMSKELEKWAGDFPYMIEPIFFATWCNHAPHINQLEDMVKVLTHVGQGYPTCTVSVNNQSRFMMLLHGGPSMEEIELLEETLASVGLRPESRRLRIGSNQIAYTVFCNEHFSITVASNNPYFGFPLTMQMTAWTDLDFPDNHHELCDMSDCNCEPVEDYSKELIIPLKDAGKWAEKATKWLEGRWEPDKKHRHLTLEDLADVNFSKV